MFLAKYALTDGIKEVDAIPSFALSQAQYYAVEGHYNSYRLGRDILHTREDAVKWADAARIKKLAALSKQIERLTNLTF